jgi:hypothetical protein
MDISEVDEQRAGGFNLIKEGGIAVAEPKGP